MWWHPAELTDQPAIREELIAGKQAWQANGPAPVLIGQQNLEAVPGKAAVALISLFSPASVRTKQRPRRIVEVRLRPSQFAVRVIPRMETPHSVERNDGVPVTIKAKSRRSFYGCLRTDAGGRATFKEKKRNAKPAKISKIWMSRQGRLWQFEALHKKPCLTSVSGAQTGIASRQSKEDRGACRIWATSIRSFDTT
jgi:hypothetical protein